LPSCFWKHSHTLPTGTPYLPPFNSSYLPSYNRFGVSNSEYLKGEQHYDTSWQRGFSSGRCQNECFIQDQGQGGCIGATRLAPGAIAATVARPPPAPATVVSRDSNVPGPVHPEVHVSKQIVDSREAHISPELGSAEKTVAWHLRFRRR
jgi:hypothetical protein